MANTRTVLASNWILNSCNCLCEHSIDTRKAGLLLCRKIQRREFRSKEIELKDDLGVGINLLQFKQRTFKSVGREFESRPTHQYQEVLTSDSGGFVFWAGEM